MKTFLIDTSASPHALLRPVPVASVTISGFWEQARRLNRSVMLPGQLRLLDETGRVDNLRRAGGLLPEGSFNGWFFNDSDVYKWIEAACWELGSGPVPQLEAEIDRLIEIIIAAQEPDGYIDSYFSDRLSEKRAHLRYTNFDLHEMYCAGHLIQAAVAHAQVTGKTTLLDVAVRLADHLCNTFGPEADGKRYGADGHPEVEMALVELYRLTGQRRYLQQADYFISARGQGRLVKPYGDRDASHWQDHMPYRQFERLYGHAVRAVYLNCGAADLYAETGEPALKTALDRQWQAMTERQMYVHGGLGPRYENEGFGRDYELPNQHGHAETCAAVANVMWNQRMLLLTGEPRYADLVELALYNNVLAGVALDGSGYYYQNPLSDDGGHRRQEWYAVSCCPSNVSRLLASLGGYSYSVDATGVWMHQYAAGRADLPLPDGRVIAVAQQTDYPWNGRIEITTATAGHYAVHLRLPGWCEAGWSLTLNDVALDFSLVNGYLRIEREWTPGDRLTLDLPMPVRRVETRPEVAENLGRVALFRGPLLYCLETADHAGLDVRRLILPGEAVLTPEWQPDLLGGVITLSGTARLRFEDENWGHQLYRVRSKPAESKDRPVAIRAVPYYAWANRAPGPMTVWLRYVD
jgi:DUF1680 family protein